jgi:peptidoglycan/LPS O-acetylase OafA/YrhL
MSQPGPHADAPGTVSDAAPTVENIQALRGIAAPLVVWAHLKTLAALSPTAADFFLQRTTFGAIGVDLFFVISGYVICLTAAKKHHRPLDFFLARIARVSPLYLVLTLTCVVLRPVLEPNLHVSFLSAWNGVFYLPLLDWNGYTSPPIGAGWTLSFELLFYSAFALLLFLFQPRKVALALPLIFLACVPPMTLFYHGGWYFPRFVFHPFVLEFSLGCLVFHTQQWVSARLAWMMVMAGLVFVLALEPRTEFLGFHPPMLADRLDLAWERVLLWGVPCALVAAGLVGLEQKAGIVLPRTLIWLGGISYSLYLTHRLVLDAAGKVFVHAGLHQPVVVCVLALLITVAAGWLCWLWLEHPLTTRAQKWARRIAGHTGAKAAASRSTIQASA